MPLPSPPVVDVTAYVSRSYPEPGIFWPTFNGHGEHGGSDSRKFPTLTAIKARRGAYPPEALNAFVEAVREACDRILVLDDFLFKPQKKQSQQSRYDQILSWLSDGLIANDIRFLTKAPEDSLEQDTIQRQFNERIDAINYRVPRRAGKATIEIRFTLGSNFPYVHDRFAIIDNELWHFGATVGGLHSAVNAATRGWSAEEHDAVRFFNDAWNGDPDARRGG